MAEVFEAELTGDHGFVRKVAIKRMLEAAAADGVAARRFLDEAVIASRLHHANVVAVVDLGLLDDRPFQVLEYVDGLDAQELLARAGGSLPIEVALVIATAVAHALDHAHTACDTSGLPLGIVHRDVKPSNVLVSSTGDVKLGDFGIAVARDRESRTEAGVVAGTVGFIAPEQRGKQPLDGRTDVFALGLTLHALLTGDSPLSDLEVELRVVAGDPVPIDPTIPRDVRPILERALAVDRLARPSSGQLATELASVLAPRLQGDGRALVRDFVGRLAPRPAARVGALDALLGIEVVEVAEADEPVHRFETRTARRAPTAPTVPLPVPAPRRRAPLAIALIGVAGVGGLAFYGLARSPAHVAPDAMQVSALDAGSLDSVVDALPVDSAVVVVVADAARPDAMVIRDAGTRPRDAAVAVAPPPDAALALGYLQVLGAIGGEDVIGASVIVDGKTLGSIPNVFAVPLGSHRVEVERRDGTRLPARTVEVTPVHNRANPLRPSW
jgi:tRNA A-37 threonylcarbamoyl transferase component Bud32